MPSKKTRTKTKTPYKSGYKVETSYPKVGGEILLPSHGCGPRCKVDYDPNDDGPWTTLQIMRVDGDVVENYACAMPRYYAIPLILVNKQLAFYEAQCHPDGTPLPPSSSCDITQRELREYSYLWNLRCRFLQAVFDMNHERLLNERWRYKKFHGFLYRMYRRFGHDETQRFKYWRKEIDQGRMPYTVPDIAEMDWKAYLRQDMTTSTRISAFLWNRVSQGYSRVVKDEPPFESWRAWRAGQRDHRPAPCPTPASSPIRELSSELDGVSAAAAVAVTERATAAGAGDYSSSNCGAGGYDTGVTAAPRMLAATATAAASTSSSSSSSMLTSSYPESSTGSGSRRGVGVVVTGGSNDEEAAEELEYEEVTGPPNSQEWASSLPLPSSLSCSELSVSSSEGGIISRSMGGTTSTGTGTSGQERFRQRQISFKVNAPEDMELAAIRCTFTRREDVKNFKPDLKIDYEENRF